MSTQQSLTPHVNAERVIYSRALGQLITELKTAQRFMDSYLELLALNLTTSDERYEDLVRHRSCSEMCICEAYVMATAFNNLFSRSSEIGQELQSIWLLLHPLRFYVGETQPLNELLNSVLHDLNIYQTFSEPALGAA